MNPSPSSRRLAILCLFAPMTAGFSQGALVDPPLSTSANSFPAALTADEKALHYITCDNQVQLDRGTKSPEIQNGGTMVSYSPFEVYRCCQHNVSHGWPYYAEELWLATPDNGLCASLYAACEVSAKAGDAGEVKI